MVTSDQITALKRELKEARDASLEATRTGDFMKVARMTAKAAQLNKAIMDAEGRLEASRTGANSNDAKRG